MEDKEWVAELKAQLEDHDDLKILSDKDGLLAITSVSYDSEHNCIVMEVESV